jgi:hypothetical protein
MGRTLGLILIAGGIIVGIIVTVLMVVYKGEGRLTAGGMALGITLGFLVLVLPQIGFGAFLLWKGGQDAAVSARAQDQRQLLDMVKTCCASSRPARPRARRPPPPWPTSICLHPSRSPAAAMVRWTT